MELRKTHTARIRTRSNLFMEEREAKAKRWSAGRFFIGALVLLVVLAVLAEANRPPKVQFWGEGRLLEDPPVNGERQLRALRAAEPLVDAERVFRSGDFYLVANRTVAGYTYQVYFIGVPNSSFGARAEKSWRYKFIATSATLQTNQTFIRLKERYETNFNSRLVSLAEADLAKDRAERK